MTRGPVGPHSLLWQIPFFLGSLTQPACIQNVAKRSSPPQSPFLASVFQRFSPLFRCVLCVYKAFADMRRGRPRKPRLTRMDAAVDAMAPLGFTAKQVKEAVKGLLKVYDGNGAWPVIEEGSYTLLLEVMLNDAENNQEQGTEVGNNSKDNCLEEGTTDIASSIVHSDIQQHEERENDTPNPSDIVVAEPACPVEIGASSGIMINESGAEVLPTETMEIISCKTARDSETGLQPTVKSLSLIPPTPATNTHPSRRRWPCYGWIDSEDEEPDDFIYLNPA